MNTVLIIEPDNFLNENLKELFELEGYKVTGATNTREAEISMNALKPSIIICDETSLNGSFAKFRQVLNKAHKNSTIVIMNADGTNANYKGAHIYLKMPFHDEELFCNISKLKERSDLWK